MSEYEIKNERLYDIVNTVKNTNFRSKAQDITYYFSLTKSRINSEKLKNKIRQLLYFLYRLKKVTKVIDNNLINAI